MPDPVDAPASAPSITLTRVLLATIILTALIIRVAVGLYLGNGIDDVRGGTADQLSYDMLAQRLISGHGFSFPTEWWPYAHANQPTAFWSYLYTLYLAAVYFLFGHQPMLARLLQASLVAVALPVLLYRLGKRAFDVQVGLIAAAISAVYLYFALYAASLMTEALYIVGILWATDAALRLLDRVRAGWRYWPTALELGLAMAITLMLRQLVAAYFLPLLLWLAVSALRRSRVPTMLIALTIAGAVLLGLVAPILVRNQRTFGAATLLNTNSGFTLFWSNHPIYGTHFVPTLPPEGGVSYQDLIPVDLRSLNEAELDRALLKRAIEFLQADPARFALLSLSRVRVYFIFWPTPRLVTAEQRGTRTELRRFPARHAVRHRPRWDGLPRP